MIGKFVYPGSVPPQVALLLTLIAQNPPPRIATVSEALVGKPAPPVSLELVTGKRFNLADQIGRIVFLAFWATWCEPCRRDIPLLLHLEANQKDVVVIGVTTEPHAIVEAYLKQERFALAAALDADEKVSKAYGVDLVPRLFVIDQKGIVAKMIRGLPNERAIQQVLDRLAR